MTETLERKTYTLAEIAEIAQSRGQAVDESADPRSLVKWAWQNRHLLVGADWIAEPITTGTPWLMWIAALDWADWPPVDPENPDALPPYGWSPRTAVHAEVARQITEGSKMNDGLRTTRVVKAEVAR